MERQQGFTLLELVVAISLFALIGLGAYHLLHGVLQVAAHSEPRAQSLRELQRTLDSISRDMTQMSARSSIDYEAMEHPPLDAPSGDYVLEFTRAGWSNPFALKRSNFQRVAYRVQGGQLQRCYWSSPDHSVHAVPVCQTLMEQASDLHVQFLNANGHWQAGWHERTLPLATEVTLDSPVFGALRRMVALP